MNLDGGLHHIPIEGLRGRLWLCGKHAIGPGVEMLFARIDDMPSAAPGSVASTPRRPHVVCLVEPHELVERYDGYVSWLRDAVAEGSATWFPIHDLAAPDELGFAPLVLAVRERLAAGVDVVAHCAAGKGRAGTLAVAVCLSAGMELDSALAHVRRHRPGAGPEVGEQSALVERLAGVLGDAMQSGEGSHRKQ